MTTDFGHTPGMWTAASKPSSVVGWPVVGELGTLIADVCTMTLPGREPPKEAFANARLIAAAPELLDALTGLEGILATAESNASGNPEWESVSAKINAARAAIAKATGK